MAILEHQSVSGKSLIPGKYYFERCFDEDENGVEILRVHESGECWMQLKCGLDGRDFVVAFGGLASSEQARLMYSLSIAKARVLSKDCLTLLILDISGSGFDSGNFQRLATLVSQDEYQVVMGVPKGLTKSLLSGDGEHNYTLNEFDYLRGWDFRILASAYD